MQQDDRRGIIEILVNVHATRKVPGPVQYSSDERGGSISLRSALGPGDSVEGTMKMLWDLAEVELEKRGLTVAKREAEVGPAKPPAPLRCTFVYPHGGICGNQPTSDRGRCARPDHQPDSGRERLPSAASPASPDERRGNSPSPSPAPTLGYGGQAHERPLTKESFEPATEPSRVTAEQAHAAAVRRRHAKIIEGVQKALDERTLPKKDYASLIRIVEQEFGKGAKIGKFADLPMATLIKWAEEGE